MIQHFFFEWVFAKKQTPGYFPSFIPKSWVSWSAHRGRSLAGATCTCCYATRRSDLYLKDSESGDWPSYVSYGYQKIYRESDDGQQWDAMAMGVPDFPTWRTIPSGMIQKGHLRDRKRWYLPKAHATLKKWRGFSSVRKVRVPREVA